MPTPFTGATRRMGHCLPGDTMKDQVLGKRLGAQFWTC